MEEKTFGEKIVDASLGSDGKIDIDKFRLQVLKYKHPFLYKLAMIRRYWWLGVIVAFLFAWLLQK